MTSFPLWPVGKTEAVSFNKRENLRFFITIFTLRLSQKLNAIWTEICGTCGK